MSADSWVVLVVAGTVVTPPRLELVATVSRLEQLELEDEQLELEELQLDHQFQCHSRGLEAAEAELWLPQSQWVEGTVAGAAV